MTNGAHPTAPMLARYLNRKLTTEDQRRVRRHLDGCQRCWAAWNRHRWDAARHSPLYTQLAQFLGADFQPYFDSSRALTAEWNAADPQTEEATTDFFRGSNSYLYNLVIWEASGNRPDYVAQARPLLARHRTRIILDYGCGIGSDALVLRAHGYAVTGCDYDSPSTRFMRWRSNDAIPLIEPAYLDRAPTADTLWIIDTLDHLADIDASLETVLSSVHLVITENLTDDRAHGRQRFHHRRPFLETALAFSRYGLTPRKTTSVDTIMVWERPQTQ